MKNNDGASNDGYISVSFPNDFDASGSYDPDGEYLGYEQDLDNDGTFELSSSEPYITYVWNDDYSGIITLKEQMKTVSVILLLLR